MRVDSRECQDGRPVPPILDAPARPPGLRDEDEVLHEPSEQPTWVENYLSQAYFPDAGVGFYLHLGGMAHDPRVWDELVVVYLPDGEILTTRQVGRGGAPGAGPRGPALSYECVDPFRTWRKTYKGAAVRTTSDRMRSGAVVDGCRVPLEFEITYRATGPVFGLGDMAEQNWASSHYEQHCVVEGWLRHGDDRVELSGTGLRDHSTGTRDLSRLERHIWCHAEWPDGRSFCLMYIANQDGSGFMNHVAFTDGNEVRYGVLVEPAPLLDSLYRSSASYPLVFKVEGEHITIDAEIVHEATLTLAARGELLPGADVDGEDHHHLLPEAMTRFRWDGRIGYGLTERTVKITKSV